MELQGQSNELVKSIVQLQRDLKRQQDAIRKLESKEKAVAKSNKPTDDIKEKIAAANAIVVELKDKLAFAKDEPVISSTIIFSGEKREQKVTLKEIPQPSNTPEPRCSTAKVTHLVHEVIDEVTSSKSGTVTRAKEESLNGRKNASPHHHPHHHQGGSNSDNHTSSKSPKHVSKKINILSLAEETLHRDPLTRQLAELSSHLMKLERVICSSPESANVHVLESTCSELKRMMITIEHKKKAVEGVGDGSMTPAGIDFGRSPALGSMRVKAVSGTPLRDMREPSGMMPPYLTLTPSLTANFFEKNRCFTSGRTIGGESTFGAIHLTVHPLFAELALRTQLLQILGGNCRTRALLHVIKGYLQTTETLDVTEWNSRVAEEFMREFKYNMSCLESARGLCAGMRYVQLAFQQGVTARGAALCMVQDETDNCIPENAGEVVGRATQSTSIGDTNYNGETQVRPAMLDVLESLAQDIISQMDMVIGMGCKEVADGDVIMTYGFSSTVKSIFLECACNHKQFEVIVLDGAPLYEGRMLAKQLAQAGIVVHYRPISGVCLMMPKCTKVFIGASKVMENGDVMSRSGTAMLTTSAAAFRKNVLCFAESFKFVNNIVIGSMTQNEDVNDANVASGPSIVLNGGFNKMERPRGYLFDITPSRYIAAIVGCNGRLHPSAVSGLVRDLDFLTRSLKIGMPSERQSAFALDSETPEFE